MLFAQNNSGAMLVLQMPAPSWELAVGGASLLDRLRFRGELVVVTGGGAGIGRATAESLANLGASVLLVGRTRETLEAARDDIRAKGGECETMTGDVSREEDVAALARAIEERWGAVKALVNNAGSNFRTPLAELPTEKWREMLGVNLDAVFFMSRALIPLLLRAQQPSILNVASSFGLVGNPLMPAYCAAKGAVVNLTRQMAVDYGPQGLRVNALCPGPTLSPRVRGYIEAGLSNADRLKAQVPLGRMAECHEIGDVAAFLVSDAASYMNGAAVAADGGQTVH
jgi:NAD(P)-dependent dehydrogenase (short-subunit alcohol dehydrogenase family)